MVVEEGRDVLILKRLQLLSHSLCTNVYLSFTLGFLGYIGFYLKIDKLFRFFTSRFVSYLGFYFRIRKWAYFIGNLHFTP
jgi:hypothetical protein